MYLLAKAMACFWTLAEWVILICLRWAFLFFKKGTGRQTPFLVFSFIAFAFLSLLIFSGEEFVTRVFAVKGISHLTLYRWSVWDLFCTLWVVLEGAVMIYVIRIYRILKSTHQVRASNRTGFTPYRGAGYGIPLFVCLLLAFYLFYHAALWITLTVQGLDARGIYHVSLFYIRICGLLWIVLEWIVAIWGMRTYFALRAMENQTR